MKRTLIISLALTLLSIIGVQAANAPLLNYKFAEKSVLSTGKWVRVTVPETGVYEISYDRLREMGFSDPTQVSVFGHGGAALPFNFRNKENNTDIYRDNPQPVGVLHTNNKLIFYGVGPEDMSAEVVKASDNNQKIIFTPESRNIYSYVSNYFLTDSQPLTTVPTRVVENKSDAELKSTGYAYFYTEQDLTQSSNGMGQLFWGEPLTVSSPIQFNFSQPYSVNEAVYLFMRLAMSNGTGGTLSVNFNNFVRSGTSLTSVSSLIRRFALDAPSVKMQIDENGIGHANLKLSVDAAYSSSRTLALDWLTVTCPISLEGALNDKNFTQQYICYPAGTNKNWKCRVPSGSVAWDITLREPAQALEIQDGYAYNFGSTLNEIVVFNPKTRLKEIGEWYPVANQNLHGLQQDGVELIIFTTTELRNYAEQIAAAHRQYDHINVAVVTPQEVYNEFNNGTPDPMTYRAFAKMLYQHPTNPLKNVMIFGRISPDIRNIANDPIVGESHISYQTYDTNINGSCLALMDYFGCMTDYYDANGTLKAAPVNVGVGVVPIFTKEEGANVASKVTEYISRKDFSSVVNESLIVACNLDEHLHEVQSADFANRIQDQLGIYDSRSVHHHIEFNKLSRLNTSIQFKDALERGKLFGLYFGHAMINGLGKNTVTLGCNELTSINNKDLGFFFFAGCDLANPAKGKQGFGDIGVTRAKRGFIASICSTSQVMSNDNENLAIAFYKGLYYDRNNKLRKETPTIGEAYAQAKDSENTPSEESYMLIGDPAIRLPLTLGSIHIETASNGVNPGDVVTVKGTVLNSNGDINADYNGYVTLKLMEPARVAEVPVQKPKPTGGGVAENYSADMTDFRLMSIKGEVKNGEFSVELPVPASCAAYMSTESADSRLPIYAATYDPDKKLGCSGVSSIQMAQEGEDNTPKNADNVYPTIKMTYDALMQNIKIEAADNVGLMPGIGNGASVQLTLDGKNYEIEAEESNDIAVTNYTTYISTAHLKPGKTYTLTASVRDVAGNLTQAQPLNITITEAMKMNLRADTDLAIDKIKFTVGGTVPNEILTLYILDREGRTVYRSETDASSVTCDVTDFAPGSYRAAMRHESAKGSRLYSNWVEFTVID